MDEVKQQKIYAKALRELNRLATPRTELVEIKTVFGSTGAEIRREEVEKRIPADFKAIKLILETVEPGLWNKRKVPLNHPVIQGEEVKSEKEKALELVKGYMNG